MKCAATARAGQAAEEKFQAGNRRTGGAGRTGGGKKGLQRTEAKWWGHLEEGRREKGGCISVSWGQKRLGGPVVGVRRGFQEGRSLPTGGLGEERYLPARQLHQALSLPRAHTSEPAVGLFSLARLAPPPLFQFSELTPIGFQEVAGATL